MAINSLITSEGSSVNLDYNKVLSSLNFLFFFGMGIPLILLCIFQALGKKEDPIRTLCIYGYGMIIYLPATLLCSFPSTLVRIGLMAYAFFHST